MIIPNEGRVVVELLRGEEGAIKLDRDSSKIGENAQLGKVIHPGETNYKEGQVVIFSEYSAVGFHNDVEGFLEGKVKVQDIALAEPEDMHFLLAEADIMGYVG